MRIGLFGAGGMGGVHLRQYRRMAGVEVRVFDLDAERLRERTADGFAAPAESAEALIAWADAVDLCLPTDAHRPVALQAIAAGKATFVEKPLAGTLEDGAALVRAADAAGVPLMVGQVVRFFPDFANGHRMVRSGAVGTPSAARTRRGGTAPTGKDGWFQDHARSGGVLLDLAIHDFDWLRWTLGEVDSLSARSVGATTGHGPDYALATLSFESGAVGHVEATWMDPAGFRTAYEVAGSGGLIQYDSRQHASLRTSLPDARMVTESPLAASDDPYFQELSAFVAALQAKTPVPVTGEDGWRALAIALAARESAYTGATVRPAREL